MDQPDSDPARSSSQEQVPPWTLPPSAWIGPSPHPDHRIQYTQHLNATSVPQSRAELIHPDSHDPTANIPLLNDFRRVSELRHERLQRASRGQRSRLHVESLGADFVNPQSLAPEAAPSTEHAQAASGELEWFVRSVSHAQSRNADLAVAARRERQMAAVRRLAAMSSGAAFGPTAPIAPSTPRPTTHTPTCVICQEEYLEGDTITRLACGHEFHQQCIDLWAATQLEHNLVPGCPCCRQRIEQSSTRPFERSSDPRPSMDTPDTHYSSAESTMPVWTVPSGHAQAPVYHAATQLPAGRLSVIVDSGAWTNLIGEKLARSLAQKAVDNRQTPRQDKLANPIQIQGVGSGVQACQWEMTCPVAVPTGDGAMLHQFSAPIVTGAGADLPGLLGLQSLQRHRAVLDTRRQVLILPGPGEIEWKMPPGTVEIPLERAPSGHLVMVLDDYDKVRTKSGGLTTPSRQFHSSPAPDVTPPVDSAPPSSAVSAH